MLDFRKIEKVLEEIENKDLFNQFIIDLFDYNLLDFNSLIIRYKFDNGLIIDIFDYKEDNKFTRYIFTESNDYDDIIDYNVVQKVINIKDYYINFKKDNKFSLFSSLFYEKDINIIKNNLNILFDNRIINIIMKHLKI